MAIFRVRTGRERFAQVLAGAYLVYMAYWGFEIHTPVALIIGASGGLLLFMALFRFRQIA